MRRLRFKNYFLIIAVVGLLIFLHLTKVLIPVESFTANIFKPIFKSFYKTGSSLIFLVDDKRGKEELVNSIKKLDEEVSSLVAENARLKSLEEENQIMREYLKFSKESNSSFVLGNVVAREILSSDNLDKNIIIDKGLNNGVRVGAGVVSSNGVIVGKVVEAKDNLSEVCLLTSRNCKLAVTMQNQDKTSGITQGELGLTIKMEFIPQTEEINLGDNIITSGLEGNIPRGLIVGRIISVNKESNELWQSATIEPLVDLDDLIIVSVLLSN